MLYTTLPNTIVIAIITTTIIIPNQLLSQSTISFRPIRWSPNRAPTNNNLFCCVPPSATFWHPTSLSVLQHKPMDLWNQLVGRWHNWSSSISHYLKPFTFYMYLCPFCLYFLIVLILYHVFSSFHHIKVIINKSWDNILPFHLCWYMYWTQYVFSLAYSTYLS